MGNAAKLFVPLAAAGRALGGDGGRRALLDLDRDRGRRGPARRPRVRGLGPSARAPSASQKGVETWLGSLARLRPELALDSGAVVLSTWADDPWVEAAYSTIVPAVEAWAPAGPFHACGEHTAGEVHALMEGALQSGVRAAREILARLRLIAAQISRRAPRP